MEINPNHKQKRTIIRIVGFVFIGIAIILAISAFNTPSTKPEDFLSGNVGMNQIEKEGMSKFTKIGGAMFSGFIGFACLAFGYQGAVARYQAGEMAPVAKDTFNYMANETQDGVRTIGRAFSEGIKDSSSVKEIIYVLCPKCRTKNEDNSKFCKECEKDWYNLLLYR